ncbi:MULTISPECIES: hypothetical protein [Pseudomonas putida group]|uniref:hypothetical protein n=1 Tax=Pseudomonas putida group TaxID=136845 RepID=UPI000FFB4A55|nr:hypothetical protein [Pseudomonas putida]UZM95241.1 hypothetical protein OPZ46_07405 [Pseudomonas putida DOT-T1E]
MGFFDKVKELALKAKCGVGIHGGDYTKASGGPACLYEKTCPDCFDHLTKHKHEYGDFSYKNHHTCTMIRHCVHCAHEDNKVKHEGFAEMGMDDFCKIKEKCIRCGFSQVKKESHTWTEVSRTDTHKRMECFRCNASETRPLSRH